MMCSVLRLCVLAILATLTFGAADKCPDVDPILWFKTDDFVGEWYEHARVANTFVQDKNAVCVAFKVTNDGRNMDLTVEGKMEEKGVLPVTFTNKLSANKASADRWNKHAKWDLIHDGDSNPVTRRYMVLDTDYKNWALAYVCRPETGEMSVYVMTRTRSYEPDLTHLKGIHEGKGITFDHDFEIVNQEDCTPL